MHTNAEKRQYVGAMKRKMAKIAKEAGVPSTYFRYTMSWGGPACLPDVTLVAPGFALSINDGMDSFAMYLMPLEGGRYLNGSPDANKCPRSWYEKRLLDSPQSREELVEKIGARYRWACTQADPGMWNTTMAKSLQYPKPDDYG